MTRNEWREKETFTVDDLFEIVRILRGEGGCPWDRVQTHESLKENLLEEAYEAVEGIETKNAQSLCEELGDVLLQIAFHCGIAEDGGEFTTGDVLSGICRKMIRRHPHVFGDKEVPADRIQDSWSEIKKAEKGAKTSYEVLDGVAKTLPALVRAEKFIEKRKKEGLDPLPRLEGLDEKEQFGECLYRSVQDGLRRGLSAEESLRAYLAKNLANSTK